MENNKSYSKYLVIFIDILGSQNRDDFEKAYKINSIFHEELEKNNKNDLPHTVYFRKIYTFSDCSYIFYGFKENVPEEKRDEGKLFTTALCNCEPIFLRFIKEKIMFRGGISYGDAYVDPSKCMFFGKAVNRAYQLESNVAIHPRIVVDNYVAEELLRNVSFQMNQAIEKNNTGEISLSALIPLFGHGLVERDVDNKFIFNYLHMPQFNLLYNDCYSSGEEFIKEFINFCEEQIEENTEYKIIDKYFYALRFALDKLPPSCKE